MKQTIFDRSYYFGGVYDDYDRFLEAYQRIWSDEIKIFQLQRKVKGVEVAVGAFFNGDKFIYPINVNFEHNMYYRKDFGDRWFN